VNQGSDTVTLLRGLGRGFFDDRSPVTFATGVAPIQAFVGHFSSATGPGLVVLNSQSNDLTYYADIANAPGAPSVTMTTGGQNPVAGVMGHFHGDGFDDIAVANNGDGRITVFDGGPNGLTPAQSVVLDGSVRPTDLAVEPAPGGGINLFVAAEGQSHVYSVSLRTAALPLVASPTPATLPIAAASVSGSAVAIVRGSGSSIETSSPVIRLTSATLEASGPSGTESQATVQIEGASGSATGAATSAGVTVGLIAQSVTPVFSSSLGSLSWFIEGLTQFAQDETWDILPLGQSDMATVAIILSTFSFLDPTADGTGREVPSGSRASHATSPDRLRSVSPLSRVLRFLGDFEASLAVLTSDGARDDDRLVDASWVWRRGHTPTAGTGPKEMSPLHAATEPAAEAVAAEAPAPALLLPTPEPSTGPGLVPLSLAARVLNVSLLGLATAFLAWSRLSKVRDVVAPAGRGAALRRDSAVRKVTPWMLPRANRS
jgi:hypothetical protein